MLLLITVFFQMLSLVIMMGAGFIAAKQGMLDGHTCTKLSSMIVSIFNPLLALSSAIGSVGQIPLDRMGVIALVAVGMFAVFILLGMVLSPFFDKDPFQWKMFQLMFVFSNLGFIGIPVVSCVLGAEYVVYVTEFTLVYNLIFYTYGVALMEGQFSLASLKAMVNPGNLITVCAMLVMIFSITVPDFIATAVTYLGNVASPLALVTIGYTVAQSSLKQIFGNAKLYLFSALKLLVIPLALLPVLRLLPVPDDLIPVCMVMFGMPVGNMPLILGTQKGLDCTTCSAGIIMTTILCIFTVPILMAVV
ncbi:MAG: AEC family transporter [Clostridiales bacterium]|nr:AEC family transporter [Clostridiales bacterium]